MDLPDTSAPAADQHVDPDLPFEPRWELAWSHRPLLLSMARSRVGWHEAEDIVSEALLRSRRAEGVPDAALRSWLVTTTLNLCADAHRASARDARRRQRLGAQFQVAAPGPEDDIADRDEARWLAGQVRRLPGRQSEAIELRSDGYEVGSIAGRMGLPYKAVESLLSRARRSLKGWAAVAVGVWALSRAISRRTAQLHIAAAVAIGMASGGGAIASPIVGAASAVSEYGTHFHRLAPAEPAGGTATPAPTDVPVSPTGL